MVTYRRPTLLATLLAKVAEEGPGPVGLVVVDNGGDDATRAIVAAARALRPGIEHVVTGRNLGPAGGLAVGTEWVFDRADPDDLVVFLDDDDPPFRTGVITELAATLAASAPDVAGVGVVGSRWDGRRARLVRIPDAELRGDVAVDYLGGNQIPTYRVRALRDVGLPQAELFFGFDDLDLGLRLRRRGWRLQIDGALASEARVHFGRTDDRGSRPKGSGDAGLGLDGDLDPDLDPDLVRPAWRRYYSARNLVALARSQGADTGAAVAAVRAGLLGPVRRVALGGRGARRGTGPGGIAVGIRGAVAGWRGALGRTMTPRPKHPDLRVLQVVTDTDRRGAQVFAVDLDAALRRQGHRVETVALAPGRSSTGLALDVLGPTRLGPATLWALRRRAGRASVVVAHGSSTLPACALALAGHRPFVYRQISDSQFWAPDPLRRLRVRMGLGRAAAIVALAPSSADVLQHAFGVAAAKITVVPNGVPPGPFDPGTAPAPGPARATWALDPDRPVALVLGALVPEKGADVAVRAAARIDDLQLLVAGDGPERGALEALADEVMPGRCTFAGSVASAPTALAAADVVLFPSKGGDSMPATLIEAGLMGRPVVATAVGAIADVVIDGETGRVLPSADVDAVADALRALLDDEPTARAWGRAARERCLATFSIDVVAAQWAAVLGPVAAR